ncbi:prolyl oligopeptidase family serine peptidase [Flavobacteriaceae bacterium]|nr:prolyl oligopeptidase family serine peptidase [Flavobacteriaceae bacterium]
MKHFLLIILTIGFGNFNFSQESESKTTPLPNYRLAAKYSPKQLSKLVHSTSVKPHWLKNGNRFWYQYKTTEDANYYLVDADKKSKTPLFNNENMAKWLTEITKDPYDAKHLPKLDLKFVNNETAIRFRITSTEKIISQEDVKKTKNDSTEIKEKSKKPKTEKKTYHFEYKIGGNGLQIVDTKKKIKKDWEKWATIAPDSSIVVFSKYHNLYWMDKSNFMKAVKNEKDSTIVENQWTSDGVKNYSYGGGSRGENNESEIKDKDNRKSARVIWSHDSKKFVYQRSDTRMLKDLWVINSVTEKRPTLETYKYHMPGEQEYKSSEILIFDVPSKEITKVALDTTKQVNLSVYRSPRKLSNADDEFQPSTLLSKKNKIYFSSISRDRKRLDINVADINTGKVKELIKERFNTYIEQRNLVLFNNEQEMIHWSERDGWAHFYLYDSFGRLKNQISSGSFHANSFVNIDENKRVLFFTANGVESSIDPYYEHLYSINLNGTGLRNLNKGDFTSSTSMADSNKYFVSNFSRVNMAPKSELRTNTGALVLSLEKADLSQLMSTGYKFPEPFKMKADDGFTDIYGVIYRPYDFDKNKKYPLIEYVYPGPQTEAVSKSFSLRMNRTDRLAQLGFIVVTLGNRGGHPARSKWYHNYGYGNLRDYGLADKKRIAEQLADKYAYINLDKVGIFGHSGGGFMSTAAMLVYPDFFKVAVSSSGNHDNTMYNSWWSETHHGVMEEIGEDGNLNYNYQIDVNQSLASKLKGNLMLSTGDIDNNVHPGATIRMAHALIKANKRFEFLLLPSQRHGYGEMTEYFFWKKADYFSKHLLGKENTDVDILEMNRDIPNKK